MDLKKSENDWALPSSWLLSFSVLCSIKLLSAEDVNWFNLFKLLLFTLLFGASEIESIASLSSFVFTSNVLLISVWLPPTNSCFRWTKLRLIENGSLTAFIFGLFLLQSSNSARCIFTATLVGSFVSAMLFRNLESGNKMKQNEEKSASSEINSSSAINTALKLLPYLLIKMKRS